MTYTTDALRDKILEMYPEIGQHGLSVGLEFDEGTDTYIVTFRRDGHLLTTHIERKDADECMNGRLCVFLGVQIGQFVKNFEERIVFGRKAA